ncbi:GNAT family N-acetyltransferase [Streptomyces sp. NPDC050560]|uniref:GNAT family N-acetyltransferase n=1 Tax=Streptomyces sp. NPDC050560 TaxID=3365630 RepID=UPI0037ACEC5F
MSVAGRFAGPSRIGTVKVVSLGFRTDLMLRALDGSAVEDRGGHLVVRTPANPGFWWGNFLLLAAPPVPGDADRLEAAFAAEFPGAAHLALGVDGTEGDAGDPTVRAALGVEAEEIAVLTARRPGTPPHPARDTVVRPLAGDADWAQALELHCSCEEPDTVGSRLPFLRARYASYRRLAECGHGEWYGAFTGGRMRSGAGVFTDGSGLARYQNVETHPDFRRRGLAAAVVHRAGAAMAARPGVSTLVIAADPGYHAIRVYRSLGFAETERQVQLIRPAD